MTNTSDKVIKIAVDEKGYLEKASLKNLDDKVANAGNKNFTKYWRDICRQLQGEPWCMCFVIWCFVKAYGAEIAKALLCVTGAWSYYTPTAASYFKAKGQWHTKDPKVADVVFFQNSERICHVGIVKSVQGNTLTTIEGNTSSSAGVVPNGGGVFEKHYNIPNSRIAGYGRPNYDSGTKLGWIRSGADWYYRIAEGQNAHGWHNIKNADGKTRRYYFDNKGKMLTDWQQIEGKWYYFQPKGDLEGAMYISDSNGVQRIWET